MAKKQLCTQVYLFQEGLVCLPLKKRGFGRGWHNGYGGKVEPGETFRQAAKRELFEEARVRAAGLERRAVLEFRFLRTGRVIESHVFVSRFFSGQPVETSEMSPFWFSPEHIPYSKMWPDDAVWFPKLLAGEKFSAKFLFAGSKPSVTGFFIKNLDKL